LSEVIYEETARRNLDPLMVLALIRIESGFDSKAISPAGARGIMQIMPETGRRLAHRLSGEYAFSAVRFTEESLDDPVLNLRLGIHYLHDLKKQFRDWTATLTAYNFGPGDTLSRMESNLALSEDFALLVLNAYEQYNQIPHSSF
jgi:soluble lytic murein transglycosylase